MQHSTVVLTNLRAATLQPGTDPYGMIEDAALVLTGGRIAWVGPLAALPGDYGDLTAQDMGGRLVTPALIDCHTHVVHGGNRATEFEMRLQGASYEEVARAGGGILSTVIATRAADQAALTAAALRRLDVDSLELDMSVPQTVLLSIAHDLDPQWKLLGSLGWQDWSEFGDITS